MSDELQPVGLQDQKQQKSFFHDLMKERRQQQTDTSAFMPEELQKKEETSEEIMTPVLGYSEMVNRIMHKDYDKGGLFKWKRGQSAEMKKVTENVAGLATLLNKIVDMDHFDEQYEQVKEQYQKAIAACAGYLGEKHPRTDEGRARYMLVKEISDRLREEDRFLDFNVETFKKQYHGEREDWNGIAAEAHRQVLRDGENGVKMHTSDGPSGTSEVRVFSEGDKTFFFKKEEKMPPADAGAIYSGMIADYKEEMRQLMLEDKGEYAAYTPEQRHARMDQLALMVKNFTLMKPIITAMNVKSASYSGAATQWKSAGEKTAGLSEEDFKAFEMAYIEFRKKALMSAYGIVAGIKAGSEIEKRNEATTVMAKLLGISDMMMKSGKVRLSMNGEDVDGLRMDKVEGCTLDALMNNEDNIGKEIHLSPKALSQMMSMQVFDLICGQVDRNDSNYFLQTTTTEDGKIIIESICGIDNDLSFGSLTFNEIATGKKRMTENSNAGSLIKRITDDKGEPSMIALDKTVADRIMAVTPAVLDITLGGLLSEVELDALKDRIKGVQQTIVKMRKKDAEEAKKDPKAAKKIVEGDDWTKVRDELEKKTRAQFNSEQIASRSYLTNDMAGRVIERFKDYDEWREYCKRGKTEFFEAIDKMQKLAAEGQTEEVQRIAAPLKGVWLYEADYYFREGKSDISFQAKHKELMEAVKKGDMKKTIEMIAWFKTAKL